MANPDDQDQSRKTTAMDGAATLTSLAGQHGRKLATLASVVVIVLMSLTVANTVLFFVENIGDETIRPAPVAVGGDTERPAERVDIASLSLFGEVASEAPAPRVVDAPETKLNLELQGVFTADDPDDSTAIVAERNKTGELFRIGDRLPGNAVLEAVNNDHILIKRGGRVEKLMFSDAPLRRQVSRTTSNVSAPVPSPQLGDTSSRLQNVRERIAARRQQVEARRGIVNSPASPASTSGSLRQRVAEYRDRIQNDPQSVLSELGVSPVQSGEASGYRISGQLPEQALRQAGLQQGDVILSVNGRPVGNVVNDQGMIDQAMAAGRVRVEVQRGSRKFYLTVPIPQ